jgi:uncharacterized membrane protein
MKSTLVFWDNEENSKRGTKRGLAIFPIYIILTLLWFFLTKKSIYSKHIDTVNNSRLIVSLFVTGVLIVSAVAVHTPSTAQKAIVYGASVGFVVYGIANAVLLATSNKWGYVISIIDTSWGIVSTALISYLLYEIVKLAPGVFKVM